LHELAHSSGFSWAVSAMLRDITRSRRIITAVETTLESEIELGTLRAMGGAMEEGRVVSNMYGVPLLDGGGGADWRTELREWLLSTDQAPGDMSADGAVAGGGAVGASSMPVFEITLRRKKSAFDPYQGVALVVAASFISDDGLTQQHQQQGAAEAKMDWVGDPARDSGGLLLCASYTRSAASYYVTLTQAPSSVMSVGAPCTAPCTAPCAEQPPCSCTPLSLPAACPPLQDRGRGFLLYGGSKIPSRWSGAGTRPGACWIAHARWYTSSVGVLASRYTLSLSSPLPTPPHPSSSSTRPLPPHPSPLLTPPSRCPRCPIEECERSDGAGARVGRRWLRWPLCWR
jgi:hypothetical protein